MEELTFEEKRSLVTLIKDIKDDFQNNGLANFESNAYIIGKLREAAERGYLTPEELYFACYIKSTRRILIVRDSTAENIEIFSRIAFQQNTTPSNAVRSLCNLQGVGIARASAILAWTFPDRYGVIDQRAWRTLVRAKYNLHDGMHQDGTNLGLTQWDRYHCLLQIIAKETQLTPQQIDTWLYNKDRESTILDAMNRP